MGKYKIESRQEKITDCIPNAYAEIEMLYDEMGKWQDNMTGTNLEMTEKYQIIDALVFDLSLIEEPYFSDLPDKVLNHTIFFFERLSYNKKRGPARQMRLYNALARLKAVKSVFDKWEYNETLENDLEKVIEVGNLISETIEDLKDIKFPGMFG